MVDQSSNSIQWELQARNLNRVADRRFSVKLGSTIYQIVVNSPESLSYIVYVDGKPFHLQIAPLGKDNNATDYEDKRMFRIDVEGRWLRIEVVKSGDGQYRVWIEGNEINAHIGPPGPVTAKSRPKSVAVGGRKIPSGAGAAGGDPKKIIAIIPGRIVAISIKEGQYIEDGQEICVLEAMKMSQVIRSSDAGTVKTVNIQPGKVVFVGDLMVELV